MVVASVVRCREGLGLGIVAEKVVKWGRHKCMKLRGETMVKRLGFQFRVSLKVLIRVLRGVDG